MFALFGKYDHQGVVSACNEIANRIREDRNLNKEQNQENATPGEIQELKEQVDVAALPGGSSSNAEVAKTKRTPKPKRPKVEKAETTPLPESDSGKRQSRRILELKKLKRKQEQLERRKKKNKETRAEKKRRKLEEESRRQKNKEDADKYLNFIVDLSPQYTVLPGKRQRMFRQAAIMLLNELLNEQEAKEGRLDE